MLRILSNCVIINNIDQQNKGKIYESIRYNDNHRKTGKTL